MAGAPLVVLAAGGTGGHVFPAEALAAELVGRGCRLALVTDRRGGALGGYLAGVETFHIRAGGVAGKSLAARLRSAPALAVGTVQARRLLGRLKPRVVVGFGGYASVPTMLAATFAGIHTAIHEQNAILGRANRLLAPRVERIATSFEHSVGLPGDAESRAIHTGMPVRPVIASAQGRPYPALDDTGPVNLLVLGGSQGARVFSQVVPAAVERLPADLRARLRISQQCRVEDLTTVHTAYRRLNVEAELDSFFDDVPERLAAAHLVIARAGASTVAEVLVVGRPAILVPYPHAIDDHQSANAHAVDEAGAGWLIPEDALNPESLAARIESLLALPTMLEKAAACAVTVGYSDAAVRLADLVCTLLGPDGQPDTGRAAA